MYPLPDVTVRRILPAAVVTVRRIRAEPVVKVPCPDSSNVSDGAVDVNVDPITGEKIVTAPESTSGANTVNVLAANAPIT